MRTHSITTLEFRGDHYRAEPGRHALITLTEEWYRPTLEPRIEGERDACTTLRTTVESLVEAKRQWYSRIAASPPPWFYFIGGALWVAGLVALSFLIGKYWPDVLWTLALVVGLAAWIVAAWLLAWLTRAMFPRLVFDFGQSRRVLSRAAQLQKFVFGSILLSIAIGILTKWIVGKLP